MKNYLNNNMPHIERTGDFTELIVDGKPFIILGGKIHNSSSSSLDYMEPIRDKLVALNCNTAIAPVYWELIEPEEGKFNFSLVSGLIIKAREHGLRLILLWFATWKNGISTYAPSWVKTDLERFPRARYRDGRNSMTISSLSAEACLADAHAFSATHPCLIERELSCNY
jgi:beta-galactosidase GanA